uniref:Putative transposase n=1 Tax=viral metagenome TaxID=1070528 RepID=A0A6M3LUX6_9ZZZZ
MDKLCPECKNKMAKAGMIWSGRTKVQRYKCNKCGRTTVAKS